MSTGTPWLDQPVLLHSSRADSCALTPAQCAYRAGYWRYWSVYTPSPYIYPLSQHTEPSIQVPSRPCLRPRSSLLHVRHNRRLRPHAPNNKIYRLIHTFPHTVRALHKPLPLPRVQILQDLLLGDAQSRSPHSPSSWNHLLRRALARSKTLLLA